MRAGQYGALYVRLATGLESGDNVSRSSGRPAFVHGVLDAAREASRNASRIQITDGDNSWTWTAEAP